MVRNLSQWLDVLERRKVLEAKPSLDRVKTVAQKLDLLRMQGLVITVAGSNGKGSCVAILQQILSRQGKKVATYTSPHLFQYSERICLDGLPYPDATLCDAFSVIEESRGGIELNYYEFSVLVALWCFKQQALDAIILEVGLGGRLDAVNIIDCDVAVITNISLEHTHILGDTRELIGAEKAGICRPNKPLVYGEADMPHSVAERVSPDNVLLCQCGQHFRIFKDGANWTWEMGQLRYTDLAISSVLPENAATALAVLQALNFNVSEENIRHVLKYLEIPGRFQCLTYQNIPHVLDVAHNPAAAEVLVRQLDDRLNWTECYAIVGMLADKNALDFLLRLNKVVDYWFVVDICENRGIPAKSLGILLKQLGAVDVNCFPSVAVAHRTVLQSITENDCLLVTGSFYTVNALHSELCDASHFYNENFAS